MAAHNVLGEKGEDLACEFLLEKGYIVSHRNWKSGKAEVDIIAIHKKEIVFVEVKTRATKAFGEPEDSVTDKKQELLRNAAENYVIENNVLEEVRFDVISIVLNNMETIINHIETAFY